MEPDAGIVPALDQQLSPTDLHRQAPGVDRSPMGLGRGRFEAIHPQHRFSLVFCHRPSSAGAEYYETTRNIAIPMRSVSRRGD
jgi:hypothetical protein